MYIYHTYDFLFFREDIKFDQNWPRMLTNFFLDVLGKIFKISTKLSLVIAR